MVYAKDKRYLLLNEIEKKREAQVASIQFRRRVLEHQRQRTYRNEYERVLNNMVVHGIVGLRESKGHKKRLNHLKKVAQASLEGTHHPIQKPKNQFE
jgi:DUF1680 family protein